MEEEQMTIDKKQTFTIENVEIFKSGNWNGDKFSDDDLDEIVFAFNETKSLLKPYLKLGHSNSQTLLQKDGLPSAGWITNIKRVGKSIFATIENIPKKIYELIQAKAYGRFSSEIYLNLKENNKIYKRALKAVALLGAETPAIGELNDFINLYENNNYDDVKLYTSHTEDEMEDVKTYEKEFDESLSKIKELENKIEEINKRNFELENKIEFTEYSKRKIEVDNYFDSLVKENKITPAQKESLSMLAMGSSMVKTYSVNGTLEKENSLSVFESIKEFFKNAAMVPIGEKSQTEEIKTEIYSKKENGNDEMDKKIRQYMKEHPDVGYRDAFSVIANGGE